MIRRLRKDDGGAVALIFVLLLLPMMAMAALVVDIGAVYVEKRQLQNAADAAALAIAQDCGRGACGNPTLTARTLTTANAGAATVTTTVTGSSVTVGTSATVHHWFAPAIGINSTNVTAMSSARWGTPSGGTAMLPLIFSWCSFQAQTGGGIPSGTTSRIIYFSKTDGTTDCTGPSGNAVPGGFAWIRTVAGSCTATTSVTTPQVFSDPGQSVPSTCSTSSIAALQNKTILLPVFDKFGGTGSGAWYHPYAYAAFRLTGYSFGGQYKWNAPCSGNERCVSGYFARMVDLSEAFTYSTTAPNLGASLIALTA
ncbi:MAG: pilus assembly protein TadG-related protein [Nakamurella sp.]